MAVTSKVETITPKMAEAWLEQNTGNYRRLDSARVCNYANEMLSANWDVNGETIKFNGQMLIDGQHRLHAIVKAGVPIKCLVVRGITATPVHVDRGKPRSVSQWLSHDGIKNASIVAAVSRHCIAHDAGLWKAVAWGYSTMTDTRIIEFANQYHEDINSSICFARLNGMPMSSLASVLFLGSGKKDASKNEIAVWFRDGLLTGADLADTDPVLHLRNRIVSQKGPDKLTRYMLRMLLTVAWNKTVTGAACGKGGLRIRLTGPAKEKVPERVLVAGVDE